MNSLKLASIIVRLDTPGLLYHGSGFKQDELKPGFSHSGNVVAWDKYENNTYLYATSDKESAKLLGFSSALEKKFKLYHTTIDEDKRTIELVFDDCPPSKEEILNIDVYLYSLKYDPTVWIKNNNPFNKICSEYKTKATIKDIIEREHLDIPEVLKDFTINIKQK